MTAAPRAAAAGPGRAAAALDRLNAAVDAVLGLVLRVSVAAIAVVVVAAVFFRYVLNDALSWSEEAARYLLVLVTFLGASVAMRQRGHMAVDVFVERLPPRARRAAGVVAEAATATVHVVLVVQGTALAVRNFDQFSPALSIPIGLVYMLIPLGGALLLLQTAQRLLEAAAGVDPPPPSWAADGGAA